MVLRVLNGHLDITVNEIMLQNKSLSRQQLFLGVPRKILVSQFLQTCREKKNNTYFFPKGLDTQGNFFPRIYSFSWEKSFRKQKQYCACNQVFSGIIITFQLNITIEFGF